MFSRPVWQMPFGCSVAEVSPSPAGWLHKPKRMTESGIGKQVLLFHASSCDELTPLYTLGQRQGGTPAAPWMRRAVPGPPPCPSRLSASSSAKGERPGQPMGALGLERPLPPAFSKERARTGSIIEWPSARPLERRGGRARPQAASRPLQWRLRGPLAIRPKARTEEGPRVPLRRQGHPDCRVVSHAEPHPIDNILGSMFAHRSCTPARPTINRTTRCEQSLTWYSTGEEGR